MPKYIKLKNGLEVPRNTILANARDIYSTFDKPLSSPRSMPEMLFKMVLMLRSDMTRRLLTEYETSILELPAHNFHVGRLRQRNNNQAMARSALALNMIVVDEIDSDIEGYLDEPVGPHMPIMPILYEENKTKQAILAS